MNNRWIPSDSYYYIGIDGNVHRRTWNADNTDWLCYKFGNCFETEEQADAAAAKIKELLLGMSGEAESSSSQLPKLTAEVFDRPDCPEWAKYAAVDEDGEAVFFEKMPYQATKTCGCFLRDCQDAIIPGTFDSTDWQNSLVERPAKLPDWCKIGGWVYYPKDMGNGVYLDRGVYLKISEIKMGFVYAREKDGYDPWQISHEHICKYMKPARPRPYNAEEMQKLVGKVLELAGNRDLVTSYDEDSESVYADAMWMNSDELLSNGYTIDGGLCGVMEHLEDGGWVR